MPVTTPFMERMRKDGQPTDMKQRRSRLTIEQELQIAGEDTDGERELESEDEAQPRTSAELRRHDYETLTAEEKAERLLLGEDRLVRREHEHVKKQRRKTARKGRWQRAGNEGEASELMYKIEEGKRSSSSEASSPNSSATDLRRLRETQARSRAKTGLWSQIAIATTMVAVAFLAMLLGMYYFSGKTPLVKTSPILAQNLSNGTHTFAPTTIVISLDGFRADFVHRGITPNLRSFIEQGVSPSYMLPSFPSLTFPNHFTLMTGRYPESHGIVGNTFWDPETEKEFYYTDPTRSMTPEWWNAEPLWETAELHGARSAIHMWPGSEAHIGTKEPTYVSKFNDKEPLEEKVAHILRWLDLPGPNDTDAAPETPRPQLIACYVPDVDADGHLHGPNSTQIRTTIAQVDGMLGSLFRSLDDRNLTHIVNVVVVSDHGMATTSTDRLIQYEDLVDASLIEHVDGWPLYGLRPRNQSDAHLHELYNSLLEKSRLPENKDHFDVYLRDENMPARYHFSRNPRIAPVWIVPRPGWAIVTRSEFDVSAGRAQNAIFHPRGLHGYDHEHPLMRAIFAARGPAFPHPQGSRVPAFQNIEVYNILCDSLGVPPVANNGTLRLPFAPEGKHDFSNSAAAALEIPHDPASGSAGAEELAAAVLPPLLGDIGSEGFLLPAEHKDHALTDLEEAPDPPVYNAGEHNEDGGNTPPKTSNPTDDHIEDHKAGTIDDEEYEGEDEGRKGFLAWLKDKFADIKDWGAHLFGATDEDLVNVAISDNADGTQAQIIALEDEAARHGDGFRFI